MESYLVMLFVTLEQEEALNELFLDKGWQYNKPDLSIMTRALGPMKCPSSQVTSQSFGKQTKNAEISSILDVINDCNKITRMTNDVHSTDKGKKDSNEGVQSDHDYLKLTNDKTPTQPLQRCTAIRHNLVTCTRQIMEMDSVGESGVKMSAKKRKYGQDMEDISFSEDSLNETGNTDKTGIEDTTGCRTIDSINTTASAITTSGKSKVRIVDKDFIGQDRDVQKSSESIHETTPCSVCGKNVSARNISRHLKSHKNFPHRCGACSLYFQTQEEKEAHDKYKHEGLQFVCSLCGVRYKFLNSLKEHMTLKHEFYKPQFSCPVCGKGFSRVGQREDHMNTHREVGPYRCTICGRTYNNKSSFNRHTQGCQTNKKYRCAECDVVCKNKLGLKTHAKNVHANKEYRCQCGKTYKSQIDKEKHQLFCPGLSESVCNSADNDSNCVAGNLGNLAGGVSVLIKGVKKKKKPCVLGSASNSMDYVSYQVYNQNDSHSKPGNLHNVTDSSVTVDAFSASLHGYSYSFNNDSVFIAETPGYVSNTETSSLHSIEDHSNSKFDSISSSSATVATMSDSNQDHDKDKVEYIVYAVEGNTGSVDGSMKDIVEYKADSMKGNSNDKVAYYVDKVLKNHIEHESDSMSCNQNDKGIDCVDNAPEGNVDHKADEMKAGSNCEAAPCVYKAPKDNEKHKTNGTKAEANGEVANIESVANGSGYNVQSCDESKVEDLCQDEGTEVRSELTQTEVDGIDLPTVSLITGEGVIHVKVVTQEDEEINPLPNDKF